MTIRIEPLIYKIPAPLFFLPQQGSCTMKAVKAALRVLVGVVAVPIMGTTGIVWHTGKAIWYFRGPESAHLAQEHWSAAKKDLLFTTAIVSEIVFFLLGVYFAFDHLDLFSRITMPAICCPMSLALLQEHLAEVGRYALADHLVRSHVANIQDVNPVAIDRLRDLFRESNPRAVATTFNFYLSATSHSESSSWQITVNRNELTHTPEKVLEKLTEQCYRLAPRVTLFKVIFAGEQALDAGGPGRDFISNLVKGLIGRAPYTFTSESGGALPSCDERTKVTISHLVGRETLPALTEKEQLGLETMGALFSWSERMANYPIGQIFCPILFKILASYHSSELLIPFHSLAPASILRLFQARESDNPVTQKMFRLSTTTPEQLEANGELTDELLYFVYPNVDFPDHFTTEKKPDLQKLKGNFQLFQQSIKEQLYRRALQDRSLPAVHAIGMGMIKGYSNQESEWGQVRQRGAETLRQRIQGTLSKDFVNRCFGCSNLKIKGYFERWFHDANIKELENFLKAATGAPSLAPGQVLHVSQVQDLSRRIAFHTCAGQIDVPEYANYETFKHMLEESIINGLHGFTLV